jgi:hypothetical protein
MIIVPVTMIYGLFPMVKVLLFPTDNLLREGLKITIIKGQVRAILQTRIRVDIKKPGDHTMTQEPVQEHQVYLLPTTHEVQDQVIKLVVPEEVYSGH